MEVVFIGRNAVSNFNFLSAYLNAAYFDVFVFMFGLSNEKCLAVCYLQGSANHSASIFTGEEEIFAFERTVSRLVEMQGDDYLNSEWVIPGQDR